MTTATLRIGQLNYLNAIPFYAKLTGDLTPGVPAELNKALRTGDLDVSLISSYEYLQNKDRYRLVPGFCIAAEQKVLSVNLYVRGGDLKSIKTIALTKQSASSAQLVKVLCSTFWHIDPTFVPLPSLEEATKYDAFLLIGDEPLLHPTFDGYTTIDLAAAWYEKTLLPMTFAVFASNGEIPASFAEQLDQSLTWAERNQDAILDIAQKRSNLPRPLLAEYFPLLRYRMSELELDALKTFATLSGL